MRNYKALVSRTPPNGLLAWAMDGLETAGITYQAEWTTDFGIEAMLTGRGKKVKAVRVSCSECGQSHLLNWAAVPVGWRRNVSYGFLHTDDFSDVVADGDSTLCPFCGTPVKVCAAARVGYGDFETDACCCMTASLLPGASGERPLALTCWHLSRRVNRHAEERYLIRPMEAYIFDGKSAAKLNGWRKSYSGTAGYSMQFDEKWRQPIEWSETFGQVKEIYGLTPELVEESCVHNSKLWEYMNAEGLNGWRSPVTYLRLYQIYPQIENLVVQECSSLLNELFGEYMRGSKWQNNKRGFAPLHEVDWRQTKPAKMLGLNKDEFRLMRAQGWGLFHWELFTKCKQHGDRLTAEDMKEIHYYGGEDIKLLIGKEPIGKCVRYLMKQIFLYGCDCEVDEQYDYDPAIDGLVSAQELSDYWEMAAEVGLDLNDPDVRWPKRLIEAHERAMEMRRVLEDEKTAAEFGRRFVELSQYTYMSGEYMILPADLQSSLKREGELLHHCVGGYSAAHCYNGKPIFFIRRICAPDEPFYTLQLDETEIKVLQNRGLRNCAETQEVAAFKEEWLRWILAGCQRRADGTPVGAKEIIDTKPEEPAENKETKEAA